MSKLKDIFNKLQGNLTPPVFVVAICDDCNWNGKPSDCKTYKEDDGWESGIQYTVAICPDCNEENVIWLTQEEMDGYKDV